MEEFDDLIQRPDEDGVLDLTHRGWVELDDAVWTMSLDLFVLNVSFNNIVSFPSRIKDLSLLKEFDCSCNKITSLPPEIGQLKRLTKLRCNGNLLVTLPEEVSECKLLVEIIASENKLKELPSSIGGLPTLKRLLLQNNDLASLPPELGNVLTMEELNVAGNNGLDTMVPREMAGETRLVLWTCTLHRDYRDRIKQLKRSNIQLEAQTEALAQNAMKLKDEILHLQEEKQQILDSMPKTYMAMKQKAASSHLCSIC